MRVVPPQLIETRDLFRAWLHTNLFFYALSTLFFAPLCFYEMPPHRLAISAKGSPSRRKVPFWPVGTVWPRRKVCCVRLRMAGFCTMDRSNILSLGYVGWC